MEIPAKLLPAALLLFAGASRAQQPITLTAVTPKILGITNLNDGVTLTAQGTGPGTFKFSITSFDLSHASGTVTIAPPASLTAVDLGYALSYTGYAAFSGQGTWTTDDPFISVYWSSLSTLDSCDSNPFETGAFSCQIKSSLQIENVGGQRLAYFDGYIFYHDTTVDFSYTITVRMYYQIPGSSTQSVIEAVQVTQSFANDTPSYAPTPLIAGKTTTIRLYPIQSNPAGEVGGQIKVISDHLLGTLQASYNVLPQSSVMRDYKLPRVSLDFKIPAAWTTKGDLTIGGQFVDVGFGTPQNPDPITLHFQNQAKPFTVRYMEWCTFTLASPTTTVCPSDDSTKVNDMADAAWFIRAVYPAADDGIAYVPLWLPPQMWKKPLTDWNGLLAFINNLRRWYIVLQSFLGVQEDQLVAWLPDKVSPIAAGDSDPIAYKFYPATTPLASVGHVSFVSDSGVQHILTQAWAERALAHEIGHNLGLRHPITSDNPQALPDPKSCFPYTTSKIQNPGYYSHEDQSTLIPSTAWDFMGYHAYQQNWLTPYTYDLLIRGGFQPQGDSINRNWDATQQKCVAPATATRQEVTLNATPEAIQEKPQPAAAASATDSIIISGTISKNGSATIMPSYRVSSSAVADQSDASGAYCLNFKNGATTLASFCFNASFDDPEGGTNTFTTESFAYTMPFPAQTTSIVLLNQGVQIAGVPVSANAPSVTITSPKAGDIWNGGSRTISWTASDADGDPLMYVVLYSTDGGNTYVPLNLDLTDTQFTLDSSTIMGGSQVYFRVMASDAINTSTASVGPITVNQTPKLTAAAASFAIGNATSSSAATGTVTLISSGSGPLTITSATVDNGAFTIIDPPMPLMIPAGRRASLTVEFVPPSNAQGAQSGMITVMSNDPLSPLKVPITGNAFTSAVPNAMVAPKSLSFSASAGLTQDLTIGVANTGAANLTVNSISISNASFTLVGVQTPLTVTPNTSQSITVRFTAPASGTQSGTVTIATNDPTNPTSAVTLIGNVVTLPALSITKMHTGNFRVSQQGATYTVTVSNTGTAPTSGTVTITDTVPTGLTLVSMAGTGWSCTANSCTRNDALSPSASYPAITVTVNVAANATSPQVNAVSVSGGGSLNASTTDSTTITSAGLTPARLRDWAGNGRSGALLYVPGLGNEYTALSNGDGTYTYVPNIFTPGFDTLRSGNFNGDGKADMVVYNSHTALAYIGFGNGDGTFNFQSLFWSPGYNYVEPGDLNGDGATDFTLYNSSTGTMYTGISNGTGQFTYKYTLISIGYTYLKLADFNGDGKADLFAYSATTGNATVGIGDGLGGFTFHSFQIQPNYNLIDMGDLNGDGKADVILYNAANGNTATGISDGMGGLTFTPLTFSPGFTAVRLGNFTGHATADVVVYNANTAIAYFGTGTGTGTFNFISLFWSPGYNWVEPEDVNGDGKTDVILYNSATGTEYTGISNGNGTFNYTYQYWGPGRVLAR